MSCPQLPMFPDDDHIGTWTRIGYRIEQAVWDAANRAKDRQDEALDAMRVSGGMTLDEYLKHWSQSCMAIQHSGCCLSQQCDDICLSPEAK
jgi:hypothetical protein